MKLWLRMTAMVYRGLSSRGTCSGLLLAAVFFVTGSGQAQEPIPDPVGPVWYGVLDVGAREFRFAVVESSTDDGGIVHHLVSFDEGGRKFVLQPFVLDEEHLRFGLPVSKAEYLGVREPDGDRISGKWKQGGGESDLTFHRRNSIQHEPADELWTGEIRPLFQRLELQLRVYGSDSDEPRILFDSLSQQAGGFRGSRTIDGDQWTIQVPAIQGTFTGVINEDRTRIDGKWAQSGLNLDLTFSRQQTEVRPAAVPRRRPQTPVAPFPYDAQPVRFENTSEGVSLAGTLTLPRDGIDTVVVLISGSGPQDRDETVFEHQPFLVLADYLSRRRIAVLRYDDRGVGQSTGQFETSTSLEFAGDVRAAIEFLKQHSALQGRPVGLIGHSEGGLIAPLVAAGNPDVAFVVLMAGTGVNGRLVVESQGLLVLQAEGITDSERLNLQQIVQSVLLDSLSAEVSNTAVKADDEPRVDQLFAQIREKLTTDQISDEDLKTAVNTGLGQVSTPWFRFFMVHDPAPVLTEVKCPILVLNGEKDVQVAPDLNLPPIRKALEDSGHERFEIVEFPGLNHLFQTCRTGGVSEYAEIEETIAPHVLQKIAAWIESINQ